MPCLQMEDFEAELETLESSAKRSKKPPARVAHYRESLDRCCPAQILGTSCPPSRISGPWVRFAV